MQPPHLSAGDALLLQMEVIARSRDCRPHCSQLPRRGSERYRTKRSGFAASVFSRATGACGAIPSLGAARHPLPQGERGKLSTQLVPQSLMTINIMCNFFSPSSPCGRGVGESGSRAARGWHRSKPAPRFAAPIRQIFDATSTEFRMIGMRADIGTVMPAAHTFFVLAALRGNPHFCVV